MKVDMEMSIEELQIIEMYITIILLKIDNEKMEEIKSKQELHKIKPECEHIYSKSINQEYPRRCLKCGKVEKVFK
jgi:hypothetical protein